MIKVVYYVNQFFAQIGGEEKADIPVEVKDGTLGVSDAFEKAFNGKISVVKTIFCGDNYMASNTDEVRKTVKKVLEDVKPDIFVAGPAFNAGRYGIACGEMCMLARELEIVAFSGMFGENPGYEMYRPFAFIAETANNAGGMRKALPAMVDLVTQYIDKGMPGVNSLDTYTIKGYLPRNIRVNYFEKERGAKRAVDTLVKKINNEKFITEYPMPVFDRVNPNPAIKDLSSVTVALVTSGGVVPKNNPDHIEASSASKFGKYKIDDYAQTAHGGYDPSYCNDDPNRVLPVDVLKEFKSEGRIGDIHPFYYTTVGNGTGVSNSKRYGQEIAKDLLEAGVQAVILTST